MIYSEAIAAHNYYWNNMEKNRKISSLMDELLSFLGKSYKNKAHMVWDVWDEAVGEKIASVSEPLNFKNKVLTVGVGSPAWAQQLNFYKTKIIETLNEKTGEETVSELRFTISKAIEKKKAPAPQIDPEEWLSIELDKLEVAEIDEELEAIEDSVLRRKIRGARVRAKQRQKFSGSR